MARARALSHPHACLKRCPVLVRRVIAEHRGPHSVCGEARLTCNAARYRPRTGPPGGPAPRRGTAVRLALASVPRLRLRVRRLSISSQTGHSLSSVCPQHLACALEVMCVTSIIVNESIYDDELSSRGPAPARAPRVSASARGRCDRIIFHRTPARHRRDSRHARRVWRAVSA